MGGGGGRGSKNQKGQSKNMELFGPPTTGGKKNGATYEVRTVPPE